MLTKEITKLNKSINTYKSLNPKETSYHVRGGVDSLNDSLKTQKDILITSPPYLQSQEYIRQSKLDLFWLGRSETEVKKISKLEIPYGKINQRKILSPTYEKYRKKLKEKHIIETFDRYFWGVLGGFDKPAEKHQVIHVSACWRHQHKRTQNPP